MGGNLPSRRKPGKTQRKPKFHPQPSSRFPTQTSHHRQPLGNWAPVKSKRTKVVINLGSPIGDMVTNRPQVSRIWCRRCGIDVFKLNLHRRVAISALAPQTGRF
jgi:hypothetical protein